jgi:hypothetical protein
MWRRVKEYVHGEQQGNLNYQDIDITRKAQAILEGKLGRDVSTQLVEYFRPLSQAYRAPDVLLQRFAQQPIQRTMYGVQLSPFVVLNRYKIPNPFNASRRDAGSCGDITRFLLHDIEQSGLRAELEQQGVSFYRENGTAPIFFNNIAQNHVWASMRGGGKSEWGLILDGSFGVVRSLDERIGYNIIEERGRNKLPEDIPDLFQLERSIHINGWEEPLENGLVCPAKNNPRSPEGEVLGLSGIDDLCYHLGFESNTSRPFISTSQPKGYDQEIYWLEGDELGFMASNTRRNVSISNPSVEQEVRSLLEITSGFTFQEDK